MNFPFFHQVIVAGGRDPKLLHTKTTDLDTDNGSSGRTSCTDVGSTANKRYFRLYYNFILSNNTLANISFGSYLACFKKCKFSIVALDI